MRDAPTAAHSILEERALSSSSRFRAALRAWRLVRSQGAWHQEPDYSTYVRARDQLLVALHELTD